MRRGGSSRLRYRRHSHLPALAHGRSPFWGCRPIWIGSPETEPFKALEMRLPIGSWIFMSAAHSADVAMVREESLLLECEVVAGVVCRRMAKRQPENDRSWNGFSPMACCRAASRRTRISSCRLVPRDSSPRAVRRLASISSPWRPARRSLLVLGIPADRREALA